MCKELTVISIFLLGLLADVLWFWQKIEVRPNLFLQLALAIFLLTAIALIGKKFLSKYLVLPQKFSPVLIWKFDRLKFQPNLLKRQKLGIKV